jgi:flavodoxin
MKAMKILVVYDSVFGNTEQIARAIGTALESAGSVEILLAGQAAPHLSGVDLLVLGSPTRGFRPTEAVTHLLNSLDKNGLQSTAAASFDTRIALETIGSPALRFVVDKGGYAASSIAKTLQKKGCQLVLPPEGFLVTGEQGPLKEGELERAAAWASRLVQNVLVR